MARSTASATERVDEEALAAGFSAQERKDRGIFFTPAPLVQHVLQRVQAYIPPRRRLAVIDPSCGAGAFLSGAKERFPSAQLFGLELSAASAAVARSRTGARVIEGNALTGGIASLDSGGAFEIWVGNPPYNGTSSLLSSPTEIARIRALLPGIELPRGTSLRDDFALFLISVAHRLQSREGAMALVTPSSLLDAFVYPSLRRVLLRTLALREVISLGAGVFAGTRVKTCVTVWTAPGPSSEPARHVGRAAVGPFAADQLGEARPFTPCAPDWALRPEDDQAASLEARWSAHGEPLDVAVPYSTCGLKTRFDELLVDEDPERLYERVRAFLAAPAGRLDAFASEHGIEPRLLPKLQALRAWVRPGTTPARGQVRRFFRYAGERHRLGIPESERAWCYLDRRLIPRGDHRMRGDFDPHACAQKLIFNVRELPLAATTVDVPGCVHMHRHARFAPLWIDGAPNLSERARQLAARLGSPWAAFQAIARFVNSRPVQELWAPAYGTRRVLPVPLDLLRGDGTA